MAKSLLDGGLWAIIEPVIPVKSRRLRNLERKRVPGRACLTGILFVLRTGIPWEMLPKDMGCGSGVTCWRWLRDWQATGVWDKVHARLLAELRKREALDLSIAAVDSGSVRAVGARGKRDRTRRTDASRATSTMSAPTPGACRSRVCSRARIAPMASSSSR